MAVPYRYILRALSLRVNAVIGTTTAQQESAYTTSPLTSTQIGSPIFPFTTLIDTVMLAEGRFVNAIANSAHPYRAYLRGVTSALSTETALPTTTSVSQPIVGVYGSVYDSTDGTPCQQRPLNEVTIRARNSGSFFRTPAYWYSISGSTIYHTRTQVIVEVCTYNEATQRAVLVANGNLLLPDEMVEGLVDEGLRQAFRDDEFMSQAQGFGAIADAWLAKFVPVPMAQAA